MEHRTVPEAGPRQRRLAVLTRALSAVLLAALLLSFLGYGTWLEYRETHRPVTVVPEGDGLSSGGDGEVAGELIYENEYPTALGIYEQLFAEIEGITPDGELKIVRTDLSKDPTPGTVYLKNNTDYTIRALDYLSGSEALSPSAPPPATEEMPPLVLIYHTHGTESYAEEGKQSYAKSKLPRSRDITKNVVAVGKVLAETLRRNGVPTLHLETMFDAGSYTNSYTYSRDAVLAYMKEYPSLLYAFDVHRDALISTAYAYKTVTYDGSTPVAQAMLVVGTDSAGADHPHWGQNLSFAVDLQYQMTHRLSNLMRPICIKNPSYNQQHTGLGCLIEIGTCVNTLAEAKATAEILGEKLAAVILDRQVKNGATAG